MVGQCGRPTASPSVTNLLASMLRYWQVTDGEVTRCRGVVVRSLRVGVRRFLGEMERAELGSVERVIDRWMERTRGARKVEAQDEG